MEPDRDRLLAAIEHLEAIERLPCSPGERAAAAWLHGELTALGLPARIEAERALGSFAAHHDAARGGLIFHPGPTRALADRFPTWYARERVVAGPALAGLGAALGVRGMRRAGGLLALVVGEIAVRPVVPGANDNLAAVAVLLELARSLRAEPVPGVRVLLLSTGAEESFMEGMRGFVARHAAALDPQRTRIVVLECVGGAEPIVLEGEGMLRMRDYTPAVRDWLAACRARAGSRCAAACTRASPPTRS